MTDYTLVRSRRRTLSMELKRDGTVVVHAPLRLGVEKIDAFVAAHETWLTRARARQAERLAAHPEPTEAEREALLARARSELPQRVAHWSRVTGLVPTGVKITGAKTRFGSCNSRNSLCFSWRLMQYPDEAIDLPYRASRPRRGLLRLARQYPAGPPRAHEAAARVSAFCAYYPMRLGAALDGDDSVVLTLSGEYGTINEA